MILHRPCPHAVSEQALRAHVADLNEMLDAYRRRVVELAAANASLAAQVTVLMAPQPEPPALGESPSIARIMAACRAGMGQ